METLTKRQGAMIMELMCPACRKELTPISKIEAHCSHCGAKYLGEVKPHDPCDR